MHHGNLIHIDHACVSACWDTAMLLDGLKYRPAVITIYGITCETEGKEERFYGFWTVACVNL